MGLRKWVGLSEMDRNVHKNGQVPIQPIGQWDEILSQSANNLSENGDYDEYDNIPHNVIITQEIARINNYLNEVQKKHEGSRLSQKIESITDRCRDNITDILGNSKILNKIIPITGERGAESMNRVEKRKFEKEFKIVTFCYNNIIGDDTDNDQKCDLFKKVMKEYFFRKLEKSQFKGLDGNGEYVHYFKNQENGDAKCATFLHAVCIASMRAEQEKKDADLSSMVHQKLIYDL